ncbi:response regulator transcription factor [Thalassomonas viridans]|uniref:Response regulator transcription factor n=1 Tax=Thalassomonas viridans TaxID=137584 RepID=A0AAF0C7Q3_9GAMM|nr:response regulator transcription factor [Thalassomonas viridans]WDE03586.1 response regulator transcription factor [Thalassomonas viridans]
MNSMDMGKLNAFVLTATGNNVSDTSANLKPGLIQDTDQEALRHFIGLAGTCNMELTTGNELPAAADRKNYQLYFINLQKSSWEKQIPDTILQLAAQVRTILFNACEDAFCDKQALLSGIEGVFYHNDRPEIILRGLTRIQQNERWFKRDTMNNALADLLKARQENPLAADSRLTEVNFPTLTKREKTIIHLVSSGAQNKEIADQLHISTNTVKTHIYSLFRKTSSRNRIELITWSQQYRSLPH